MYKLYSYWSAPRPEDVEAFEQYYASTHCPKAAAVPRLERLVTSRTSDGFEGGEPMHYRIAEMVFADRAAFEACTESQQWSTLRECSGTMIERFGVTLEVEAGDEVIADLPGS
ncbi:MAG: EthD family reductase [Solirubrobacterales bacterium]